MNKALPLSFLLFLLLPFQLFSQKNNFTQIDSLLAQSTRLTSSHTDSSLRLAFRAAELSEKSADATRMAKSFQRIAEVYEMSDDIDMLIFYYQKALDAASKTSDSKLITYTTFNLGRSY